MTVIIKDTIFAFQKSIQLTFIYFLQGVNISCKVANELFTAFGISLSLEQKCVDIILHLKQSFLNLMEGHGKVSKKAKVVQPAFGPNKSKI